jgi:hypothetical protein
MSKLRELKDRMTHKADHEADLSEDARRESDDAFLHKTSRDLGVTVSDSDKGTGGIKPIY